MTRRNLIARVTGLRYCGADCGCGEHNRLWWFPIPPDGVKLWVPGWMNGGDTSEIWDWLVEHGKVRLKVSL